MEAEDSGAAGRTDRVRTAGAEEDAGFIGGRDGEPPEAGEPQPEQTPDADTGVYAGEPLVSGTSDADADSALDSEASAEAEQPARKGRPVSSGIGCAALLLPLIAVAGAILCFAAGILSTVTGCTPNGSALCSANGAWFEFVLPLFVSPIIAAATAIGAVTVRRHRSSWLAVGYGVVFISIIVGLASASTGSS